MSYNYDIDGISGATVSFKSVTSDIKNTSKEVSEIVIDKFFGFLIFYFTVQFKI